MARRAREVERAAPAPHPALSPAARRGIVSSPVMGGRLGAPWRDRRRCAGSVRVAVEPVLAVDPLLGAAGDLGGEGAGLAPALAQGGNGVESLLPFRAEDPGEE